MKYNESIEADLLSLPYLIKHYFAYESTIYMEGKGIHLAEETYVKVIDCIKRINKKLEKSK